VIYVSTLAIVALFAVVSVSPSVAERNWWNSSIFGDGWCYGDVGLGECSVDIYDFDPAEWCRQPREANTELEFCQNPDNYSRASLDPEISSSATADLEPTSPPYMATPAPLGTSRVLTIVTDASSYPHDGQITFSGTTQGAEAREIVSVVIEPPTGSSKIRSGLTTATNVFTLSPIDVRDAFDRAGVYTIKAFTNPQGANDAVTLSLRYENGQVTRHTVAPDARIAPHVTQSDTPQAHVDLYSQDPSYRAWLGSRFPDLASQIATRTDPALSPPPAPTPKPELVWDLLVDPYDLFVKDRWCYGSYARCFDMYDSWWPMTPRSGDSGNLVGEEYWCFGTITRCESRPDSWCGGTRVQCYEQAGHPLASDYPGPRSHALPTVTGVETGSSWGFEWSRVNDYDRGRSADNWPPQFVERPVSETIPLEAKYYTLSLSMADFVVVDDMDAEPLVDCVVGGVPAIMRDRPHKWVLRPGAHYIQCTATDVSGNTTGMVYKLTLDSATGLFPSRNFERLFRSIMAYGGYLLEDAPDHYQVLKLIKYFHGSGMLEFDIGSGDGIGTEPTDAICATHDTDIDLLNNISLLVGNAEIKHCLELLAERGAFDKVEAQWWMFWPTHAYQE